MAVVFPENPRFKQVATEMTHPSLAGSIFPADLRVLMRSPTHVMFVGLGLRLYQRESGRRYSSNAISTITSKTTIAGLSEPAVVAKIEEIFGEGAAEAALAAKRTRGMGTVLVDGGGDKMPETRKAMSIRYRAEREFVTVNSNYEADLTGQVKTCRQCGGPLTPHTQSHRFSAYVENGGARTLDDCQRRTNHLVVSTHAFTNSMEKAQYIEWFTTWDGESYVDPDFCKKDCILLYARRAIQELPPLPVGVDPQPLPKNDWSQTHHYDRDEEQRRSDEGVRKYFEELRKRDPSA